jgi:hypothetical protein
VSYLSSANATLIGATNPVAITKITGNISGVINVNWITNASGVSVTNEARGMVTNVVGITLTDITNGTNVTEKTKLAAWLWRTLSPETKLALDDPAITATANGLFVSDLNHIVQTIDLAGVSNELATGRLSSEDEQMMRIYLRVAPLTLPQSEVDNNIDFFKNTFRTNLPAGISRVMQVRPSSNIPFSGQVWGPGYNISR